MNGPWVTKILVVAAWSSLVLTVIGWALVVADEEAGLVCVIAGPSLGLLTFWPLSHSAARKTKALALLSGLGGTLILVILMGIFPLIQDLYPHHRGRPSCVTNLYAIRIACE